MFICCGMSCYSGEFTHFHRLANEIPNSLFYELGVLCTEELHHCIVLSFRYDLKRYVDYVKLNFRLLWPCIMNVGWRERNQQDATNLMFSIKLLYQHVSAIIMPIIRRTRVCTAAYGVLHWLWWLWLCGAGTQAVCTVKVTVNMLR